MGFIFSRGRGRYAATLTQSGTDNPIATVAENHVGSITWLRTDVGAYLGSVSGNLLPQSCIFMGSRLNFRFETSIIDGNVQLFVTNNAGVPVDGGLSNTPILIIEYEA